MTEQQGHCIVRIPSCGCEIVEVPADCGDPAFLRIRGCEEHPDAQGSEKGNAWAIVNYIKQLEAEIETYKHEVSVLRQLLDDDGTLALETIEQQEGEILALKEYATHKPGCHENGEKCICELDALLTSQEKPTKTRKMPYAPH